MLGTARDGADAAVLVQHAGPTLSALLSPHAPLLEYAKELGIEPCVNGFLEESLGDGLHTGSTPQRQHDVDFLDGLSGLLDEYVIALALDGKLAHRIAQTAGFGRNAQRRGNYTDLALSPGQAHSHAGATAQHQYPGVIR